VQDMAFHSFALTPRGRRGGGDWGGSGEGGWGGGGGGVGGGGGGGGDPGCSPLHVVPDLARARSGPHAENAQFCGFHDRHEKKYADPLN